MFPADRQCDVRVDGAGAFGAQPHQFPDHESYKWLIPGLQNPLHLAGGSRHISFALNFLQPGSFVQDTRVSIRSVPEPGRDGEGIPASESAAQEVPT